MPLPLHYEEIFRPLKSEILRHLEQADTGNEAVPTRQAPRRVVRVGMATARPALLKNRKTPTALGPVELYWLKIQLCPMQSHRA